MNSLVRHDQHCRLCGSQYITSVFKLTETPLEDQFILPEKLTLSQPTFPLEWALCEECGYLFLPHIVSPEASYTDYIYVSGVTVGLRNHYDQYAYGIKETYQIPAGALAIDLGSNDGSMLSSLKKAGLRVLGVEPAGSIAAQANDQGLKTLHGFFTAPIAERIRTEEGMASLITANYMFANIDDMRGFAKLVAELLTPEGIFVVQTGYHPQQMKIKMFDYVYHEHFSYFTAETLQTLFAKTGLELIYVEKTTPKGGSLRAVAQLKGSSRPISPTVDQLITEERQQGMRDAKTYQSFAQTIEASKQQVKKYLEELKNKGKKIVGIGASHSTTTLIYHFELAPFLEYLVDDNTLKHGRYSPGYHIPVYSTEKIYANPPDCLLILGWQHQQTILKRHQKFLETGGQFCVPLPELRIITAAEQI